MDVIALLEAKGIDFFDKGQDEVAITCPNAVNHQGGVDSNPSCNINTRKFKLNCLACGFKLGEVGLSKWLMGEDLDEFQTAALSIKGKLRRMKDAEEDDFVLDAIDEFTLVPPSTPFREEYRGISASTYEILDARRCSVGRYADRIFFKIWQHNRLLGIDARALKEGMVPKYLRPKGAKAAEWLYPYDHARSAQIKRVVLCEGIFDAINYYDKMGTPEALAVFGVNNFSTSNVLDIINLNVDEIILMPDNDKAGHAAAQTWSDLLAGWGDVYIADTSDFTEGEDLGNCSKETIQAALANKYRVIK